MKRKVYPSIADVAKLAEVSIATVSRVLSNSAVVSAATEARVNEAVARLNYAKSGGAVQRRSVAVFLPDILDQFFANLLKGISDVARLYSFDLVLCNSDNTEGLERAALKSILQSSCEGVIIVPTSTQIALVDLVLSKPSFHHVFLDRIIEDDRINYIVSDDKEGAYLATKYLLDLGHRKILYIGGPKGLSTEMNRLSGYRKAIESAGLPADEKLILEYSFTAEDAYRGILRAMHGNGDFSAVFCANDTIAFAMKRAAEENGIPIPGKLSIVGYGNIPLSDYLGLTTVSMPAYEMGKSAFQLFLDLAECREKPVKRVVLRPSIIIRSSCRKIED
ncbi:MAG: LacI family DNA-binding transcriptional regulator [Rectinemataceae bacterium]|jgi:LacI family transcriptional regulator